MTTIDPNILKAIEKTVEEKLAKSVESVQISLLRDNFLTREEFLEAMERIDKRFEAMDKQFEATQKQMDKRFEAIDKQFEATQKQMDKRFEAMDKQFEATQKQMDERFKATQKQMDERFEATQKQMDERFEAMQKQMDRRFEHVYSRLDQMDLGYGYVVEGMGYSIVKREFKQRGINLDFKPRQHFTDESNSVHPDTQDVEVDIFHVKPNIIGEATLRVSDLDKARTFIKKIEFIEKMYKSKFSRYFICFRIDDKIKNDLETLLKKYEIELIIPKID